MCHGNKAQRLNEIEQTIANHQSGRRPIPDYLHAMKRAVLRDMAVTKSAYRQTCDLAKEAFNRKQEEKLIEEAEKTPYLVLRASKAKRTTPNISLATWVAHFSNVLNKENLTASDSLHLKDLLADYESDEIFVDLMDSEIALAISKLKSGKAPGPDKMLNEHIKLLEKHQMVSILTKLFNTCVRLHRLPKGWCISDLFLLYKGKGPKTDVNNFRGIALSNVLYKLFDKVIIQRVFSRLRQVIPVEQYGYMPGRGTIPAVQRLHDNIIHHVTVRNEPLYVVFVDYSKAFDSVNRRKLFQKLIDTKLFPAKLLQIISLVLDVNFLSIFDGVQNSNIFVQSNGTLQGGSSSPIYYIFYAHDLHQFVNASPFPRITVPPGPIADPEEVKIISYADDLAMASTSLRRLQEATDQLVVYSDANDLSVNAAKTVVVKFRKGGNISKHDKLQCKGINIDFQNSVRYLGVILSHIPTSFAKHIKSRSLNANLATFDIKKLTRLSTDAAIRLFFIKVAPIASFGIAVAWPYLTLTDLRQLNMVFDSYLKRMLSVHKSSKNRIIHFILAAGSFVEYLHSTFNLPYTAAFGALLQERDEKQKCLPENLEQVLHTIPNRWRNPLQDDRHIFTRFLMHGFHFKYCSRADFHEASDTCVCKFCGDLCEFYHYFSCASTPFQTFAELADHKYPINTRQNASNDRNRFS
jgi:Reverse transcriptase (RNA-dependent DNA polymerase)